MGVLSELLSPSAKELWSEIANDIGGELIKGSFWMRDTIVYRHNEWEIVLDIHRVPSSQSSRTTKYTRMRAPFSNKNGLRFKIYREGIFASIGKFFGMQDIEIGDPFFDKQFVIKGNDEEKLKLMLSNSHLKELLKQQPAILFEIRDDEGLFTNRFPDGVDLLHFQALGLIKDKATLKALFDLFAVTLDYLVRIDSAYKKDPNITIR